MGKNAAGNQAPPNFLEKLLRWLLNSFWRPKTSTEITSYPFDLKKIPQHIAIIMDGNGRLARQRGLPRVAGHRIGVEALRRTVNFCGKIGLGYLSVYTFSTENWQRPKQEVDFLMSLLEETITREVNLLNENNVRIRFLGNLEELAPNVKTQLEKASRITENNNGLTLNIMFNYGGRAEIVAAAQKIGRSIKANEFDPEKISAEIFEKYLYTIEIPDPELLIRTGGDQRISNFFLWQSAYTELWFTPVFWPDFGVRELTEAIVDFQNRKRRFGGLDENL